MLRTAIFWARTKRERLHAALVLDVGDYIVDPAYAALAECDMTDAADLVAEQVKDNVWARIPGELSA